MISWFSKSKSGAKSDSEAQKESSVQKVEEKSSLFGSLKKGLSKTASSIGGVLQQMVGKTSVDAAMLEALEDVLIMADMGAPTARALRDALEKERFPGEVNLVDVQNVLQQKISDILKPIARPLVTEREQLPFVLMVCGVNGSGKTTSIGKLASHLQQQGKHVIVAAADTFRAAAVEQLQVWASRLNIQCITGEANVDPASVAHEALVQAKAAKADVLIIDTAGRLHTKTNLMEQLAKMVRVIKKQDESAPHAVVLVLDATVGQNAYAQVEQFNAMVPLTGLIVTKLDGTAKGGVVVGLAQKFGLPVHLIGVGESLHDLRPFDADEFAGALVGK